MEQTAVRAHSGWREDEIDRLWHEIQAAMPAFLEALSRHVTNVENAMSRQ